MHSGATFPAVVPAKAGQPNLSPRFRGERPDRCDDAQASSCDPGQGRGTALTAIADFSGRKVFRIAGGFSAWSDPRELVLRDGSASPLTRSLRYAAASTSPREERGEVKEARGGDNDVPEAAA
jgi:hypothetical protein